MFYIRFMMRWILTLLVCLFAVPATALELGLPVACEMGKTCWVQQYVDHDAGPGATDYACGIASYDGHDGTDFRALSTAANIDVIAAAPGIVKGWRDGVVDRLITTEADKAAVKEVECGNGVVLQHEDGWETQYCHLREGSIAVKKGQRVALGEKLGLIGASGLTEFPHMHLSVRHGAKKIDPFSADDATDCQAGDRSLWSAAAQNVLGYQNSDVLLLQWSEKALTRDEINAGSLPRDFPNAQSPAVFATAFGMLFRAGDTLSLRLTMPEEEPSENRVVLDRNKAVYMIYVGKNLRKGSWPKGKYTAEFRVWRGTFVVVKRVTEFEMK